MLGKYHIMESSTSASVTYPPHDLEKSGTLAPISLSWSDISFAAKGRETPILSNVNGEISSGKLLAVMGPSGAGKSTFLDVLCRRASALTGEILLNGSPDFKPTEVISFVEQDDAFLPRNFVGLEAHIDHTLKSLGLQDIANNRIGTPLQRGISGGQKRRVTIACSMVAQPRILVLDEPTSGLDAASSLEVISSVKRLVLQTNTVCIATIHQPNYETFALFDQLLLLAGGRVVYNGPCDRLDDYLSVLGRPVPQHSNPADHAIAIANTEFFDTAGSNLSAQEHLVELEDTWRKNASAFTVQPTHVAGPLILDRQHSPIRDAAFATTILMRRNVTNYSRNLLAFGIRFGMYCAMGFLLATVWINLGTDSSKLQDRLSVFFFSVAFLGFMSVSGIPAFLEERSVFIRERGNGLYTPGPYVLANTLTTVPFLFACTLAFALIAYFAIGLHGGATHFFRFLIYLFLGVFAAESQSVLVAAILPIFVAALAIASFANGLWMVVQGYFIRATALPRFWYYTFHFIDFQTFAFELLTRNDLIGLTFDCPTIAGVCSCPYPSSLTPEDLGYAGVSDGLYVGILLIIIVVYRLALWGVLVMKKR
ncbi:hypothetical protein RQP46_009453 [Phenoliferia psychrophenolica]